MGKKKAPKEPPKSDSAEKKPEANPRRALFNVFYGNGGPDFPAGNAYRSAIAAGYPATTAKAKCHILARESRVRTATALEALGCDGFSQARKLLQLRQAKTVKWNANKSLTLSASGKTKRVTKAVKGGWDIFDDGDLQLRATQEINKIQAAYPNPEAGGDNRTIQVIFPDSFANAMTKENAGD